ncbi:inhibitor of KinA sporulation pathway (predicted exonuclease) [Evansella vedderi]|uniref:Inhibitor of KinA sporulation pathway (Predicted exonuclease) n=1 Tax=Evansella vedderi TaxID=38282 RepID=A0ABU0A050_9BACI|nr:3'-5' exonuclease [Evansella vedderi]MDQ0255715.1 inhibitor of KinA sporulation pathway (predicted exonuclease) [Evansella vedderi]
MIAVVYDLELVKRFRKGQLSEIVEIGACKVDLKTNKMVDQLQIYTLPKSGHISKSTRKFIKMTDEDVKKAIPFQQGIKKFSQWLGKGDYYLCSWGKDDKVHIIDQCVRNKINLDWFQNYNDIQPQIGKALNQETKGQQLGLKNALGMAGIDPVGKAHRGIDDTINTARLLLKYKDHVKLYKNSISQKELKLLEAKRRRKRYRKASQPKINKLGPKPPKSKQRPLP